MSCSRFEKNSVLIIFFFGNLRDLGPFDNALENDQIVMETKHSPTAGVSSTRVSTTARQKRGK